jgi:hypothetical protein
MTITFTIPLWLIWGYMGAGIGAAAYSWVEFYRQSMDPLEVMRLLRFWIRMPLVTAAIVLLWPYAMWTFVNDRLVTKRAMARYRGSL